MYVALNFVSLQPFHLATKVHRIQVAARNNKTKGQQKFLIWFGNLFECVGSNGTGQMYVGTKIATAQNGAI